MHVCKHPPRQLVAGGEAGRLPRWRLRQQPCIDILIEPKTSCKGTGRGKCSDCDRGSQASTAARQMTAEVKLPPPKANHHIFASKRAGEPPYRSWQGRVATYARTTNYQTYWPSNECARAVGSAEAGQHGRRTATGAPHPGGWGHTPRMQRGKRERQSYLRTALDDGRHSKPGNACWLLICASSQLVVYARN